VSVQAGHLTGRGQQGHPHEDRKRALHALSVYGSTGSGSTRPIEVVAVAEDDRRPIVAGRGLPVLDVAARIR
jgi:hypothetical protein